MHVTTLAVARVIQGALNFVNFGMGTATLRFRCPCCGFRTLDAPSILALCPVCWWEDDGHEDGDAHEVRNTVNGDWSLDEARLHYSKCGASHPRFVPYVRKPEVSEQ